jgi:hypothetical protein
VTSGRPRLQRLSRDPCGPASMAPWAAPRKAACESAPRRPRTHAGICNDASRPRIPRSSAPPSAARTVTSSWNLAHQCRNGRLRPRRRGLRRTERAYGDRLVFTREYARGGFDHALDGASSAEPTRCISGNRPKSSPGRRFPRPPSRSGGEGGVLQLRSEAGLAWERASRPMCDGHSPKILLVSRSRDRRNETRRPLISLGYARLKPNPGGQQRLYSTIFPFDPQE